MSVLYDRIHALCDAKGIKDGTMCREAGVPRSTFQELKMERTENLSLKNLHKIAEYFGVSVSDLTGEQKENPPQQPQSEVDADIKWIEQKLVEMSKEKREALMKLIRTM